MVCDIFLNMYSPEFHPFSNLEYVVLVSTPSLQCFRLIFHNAYIYWVILPVHILCAQQIC